MKAFGTILLRLLLVLVVPLIAYGIHRLSAAEPPKAGAEPACAVIATRALPPAYQLEEGDLETACDAEGEALWKGTVAAPVGKYLRSALAAGQPLGRDELLDEPEPRAPPGNALVTLPLASFVGEPPTAEIGGAVRICTATVAEDDQVLPGGDCSERVRVAAIHRTPDADDDPGWIALTAPETMLTGSAAVLGHPALLLVRVPGED